MVHDVANAAERLLCRFNPEHVKLHEIGCSVLVVYQAVCSAKKIII